MQLEVISRHPAGKAHPIPLLFVHGAWHAAWCWDEYFLPYFAEHGYAVHALSLHGHGRSAGQEQVLWYRSTDYVADVALVASQLQRPPVLVGHSMGGWIVQKYLEQHYVPAAVLLAPMPPSGPIAFLLDSLRQHPIRTLYSALTGRICSPQLAHVSFFSDEMPQQQVNHYYERLDQESRMILLDFFLHSLRPRVSRTIPLLVLGALDDRVFSLPEIVATARLQNVQPEAFPHMAHNMMLEPHWQRVADRIVAWLWAHGI